MIPRWAVLMAAMLVCSCTTPPKAVELEDAPVLPLALDTDFQFRKIKRFLNQDDILDPNLRIKDEMINFEQSRVNYGVLTAEEAEMRQGTYFDFFWRARRPADITVRLEYRQARLGNNVRAQEISYSQAKGTVKTSFAVIGDEFINDGPVTAWRCLLIENNRIVGFTQSFLWK